MDRLFVEAALGFSMIGTQVVRDGTMRPATAEEQAMYGLLTTPQNEWQDFRAPSGDACHLNDVRTR